ncbi:uncharacterized protein LOC117649171 isoform X2 [Thrips palmi]|uniref:Uncharacterized protein LOC117649171 isoform X2 n=1 Tax=Thrips palmi TaxID=161013 RepID=A0A6P8Z519_THRPL|nr:uncharacterized protein LOC117649171 isoform X2 [Thrips palmi]
MDIIGIKVLQTVAIFCTLLNASLPQCVHHDGVCTGEHGTVGNCCNLDNLYCHKTNPSWKEGRCYYGNGPNDLRCIPHDGVCTGEHGTQGNCCTGQGLYCHKGDPSWPLGRCYFVAPGATLPGAGQGAAGRPPAQAPPAGGRPTVTGQQVAEGVNSSFVPPGSLRCVSHDGVCTGEHGTVGNCCSKDNLYCHKSNPQWSEGRCYYGNGPNELRCIPHDGVCAGEHGTQGNCCTGQGLYCHKGDPSWPLGRCYFVAPGTTLPGFDQVAAGRPPAQAPVAAARPPLTGQEVVEGANSSFIPTGQDDCIPHRGVCTGANDSDGNCCADQGLYCHKEQPHSLTGRCFVRPILDLPEETTQHDLPGQSSDDGATDCVPFDGECTGVDGTRGNCCSGTGLYCNKAHPSFPKGRCFYREGTFWI